MSLQRRDDSSASVRLRASNFRRRLSGGESVELTASARPQGVVSCRTSSPRSRHCPVAARLPGWRRVGQRSDLRRALPFLRSAI